MTDENTPVRTAQERHEQGFNCAQSVFSAFAAQLGLNEQTALQIAAPFGGGVARQGDICGAVSGAMMALGLSKGHSEPGNHAQKEATYAMAEEFALRFRQLHGSISCRDLIGYQLSNPDEAQEARESGVFKNICPRLIQDAAILVDQILSEKGPQKD